MPHKSSKFPEFNNNQTRINEVMNKPRKIIKMMSSEETDPTGSYTGVPENKYEKPVQDADDL